MANANITLIALANTFNDWRIATNNLANSVNELRNGNYYKDGGGFTLPAGTLSITGTSGTTLSVTANALISGLATMNTSIHSGAASFLDNVTLTGATSWLTAANVITAPYITANSSLTVNGYLFVTGSNVGNAPLIAMISGNAIVNIANNFFVSNTGNTQIKGNLNLTGSGLTLNVVGDGLIGGNVVVTNNISIGGRANVTGTLNVGSVAIGTNAQINLLYLDPTKTYSITNGNAIFNNVTIQGTTTFVGSSVYSTDTLVLRSGVSTVGDGHLTVQQGTTNGNADIRFLAVSNVWQTAANVANGYSTILTVANTVDNFLSTSITNVATANAVNAAYAGAISNATAMFANTGVFVAQRRGLNIIQGGNMTITMAANGANANLVDATFSAAGGALTDSNNSTSIVTAATANSVNWLRLQTVNKSGDSMTGNLNMANNTILNPTLKGYREAYTNTTVTTAYTIDMGLSNFYDLTLAGNPALTFSNCGATGNVSAVTVVLRQSANGSNTVTYANTVRFNDNTTPVLTTTPSTLDILYFTTFSGGAIFYGSQVMANIPVA
jgi:cytoskeletal protein CcmA (bactofilin family)